MMTDEELDEIDRRLANRDMDGLNKERIVRMMREHIDEQSNQIATLKAALIERYAISELTRWGVFEEWEWDNIGDDYKNELIGEAKKQLAQEYPDIKWEE